MLSYTQCKINTFRVTFDASRATFTASLQANVYVAVVTNKKKRGVVGDGKRHHRVDCRTYRHRARSRRIADVQSPKRDGVLAVIRRREGAAKF